MKEAEKALEEVGKKHGVHFEFGNIRFTASNFRSTLKATKVAGDVEDPKAIERAKFEADAAKVYGIDPEDYGRAFKIRGKNFTLVGLKPRARKYPLIGRNGADGKLYKFPQQVLEIY